MERCVANLSLVWRSDDGLGMRDVTTAASSASTETLQAAVQSLTLDHATELMSIMTFCFAI